ncbi:hypothetical protein [Deinococcus yavapaiensis]|uniref:hypothetical protein n=1 Tax=Deinococcus yavapaiensis TaxID=309889 RepID=UPI0011B54D7B|nr:hypothetical protein [Deinococcus yavapaiensis]
METATVTTAVVAAPLKAATVATAITAPLVTATVVAALEATTVTTAVVAAPLVAAAVTTAVVATLEAAAITVRVTRREAFLARTEAAVVALFAALGTTAILRTHLLAKFAHFAAQATQFLRLLVQRLLHFREQCNEIVDVDEFLVFQLFDVRLGVFVYRALLQRINRRSQLLGHLVVRHIVPSFSLRANVQAV